MVNRSTFEGRYHLKKIQIGGRGGVGGGRIGWVGDMGVGRGKGWVGRGGSASYPANFFLIKLGCDAKSATRSRPAGRVYFCTETIDLRPSVFIRQRRKKQVLLRGNRANIHKTALFGKRAFSTVEKMCVMRALPNDHHPSLCAQIDRRKIEFFG